MPCVSIAAGGVDAPNGTKARIAPAEIRDHVTAVRESPRLRFGGE